MNKKFILIFAVVAVVLLYLFSGRKTVGASTAPVSQPGLGAGGVQFAAPDPTTGLPIFYKSLNPPQYVGNRAGTQGGFYVCPSGYTPALNGEDGAVYCVIPANATGATSSPIASATAASETPAAPQGPTESGGYLGQPTAIGVIDYQAPPAPQGPTLGGGFFGDGSLGAGAPAAVIQPDSLDPNSFFSDTTVTGAGADPMTAFLS